MKNLLLLIVLMMFSHMYLCVNAAEQLARSDLEIRASTTNLYRLVEHDSEAQLHVRAGLEFNEKECIKKQNTHQGTTQGTTDAFGDSKIRALIVSDYVTFGGNILTHLCSPRAACMGILSVMGIYCILNQLTYGIEYCSKSFPDADGRCIDQICLGNNNLLESYFLCKSDRYCWRENRDRYEICLDDECVYAQSYCDNRIVACLLFMCVPLIICMKNCAH